MLLVAPAIRPYVDPEVPRLLGNRYALHRRLAVGGMGEVWSAHDTVLHRSVAVKILRDNLVDTPGFLDRFRAEARHTAALAHSGVARVFDYGEDATRLGGRTCVAYLVMELVPGRPLSAVIAERGPLPISTTISILAQTAEALHAAHQAGIIHRDVKPGNLMLLDDGTVKVTDFGVARAIDAAPITDNGQVVGTASYLSPEQACGHELTPASDVYSLAVVGYELLTGHPPFTAGTPAALALAHVQDEPPRLPPTVPVGLREVIEHALAKNPADRPADAAAFAAELHRLQLDANAPTLVLALTPPEPDDDGDTTEVIERSPTALMPPARVVPARGKRRWLVAVTAAVVALFVGIAVLAARGGGDPSEGLTPTAPPATEAPTSTATVTTAAPANNTPAAAATPSGKGGAHDKPKGKHKHNGG
jgi:serine/threonine protein kinase